MKAYRKEIFKSRFQEHYPRLCCIACGYVSDKEDAEDIVQELFISVWNKGLDSLSDQEFAAYMTTAVRNSCISFLRKRRDDVVSIEDYHQPQAAWRMTTANRMESRRKRCWNRHWPHCRPDARIFS